MSNSRLKEGERKGKGRVIAFPFSPLMPRLHERYYRKEPKFSHKKIFFKCFFSDGWTTDDLQYLWKTLEPVQIVRNLHLPRFTLEKYISDYCNIETNTGKKALPYKGN